MEYQVTITLTGRNLSSHPTNEEVFDLLAEILVPGTNPEHRDESLSTPQEELSVKIEALTTA